MESHGIPLDSMEFHSIAWNPWKFRWIPCNPMKFYWVPWKSMGFNGPVCWIPVASQARCWTIMVVGRDRQS